MFGRMNGPASLTKMTRKEPLDLILERFDQNARIPTMDLSIGIS